VGKPVNKLNSFKEWKHVSAGGQKLKCRVYFGRAVRKSVMRQDL
jgi:hypothetical protein